MSELEKSIKKLRSEGKSYRQIQSELNCSMATISYHLSDGQKDKNKKRTEKNRYKLNNVLTKKLNNFISKQRRVKKRLTKNDVKYSAMIADKLYDFERRKEKSMEKIDIKDVFQKLEEHPFCYLTGDRLKLDDSKSFNFDHKIPVSRGGDNSLDNLGICTREANMSKNNMTLEEYLELCKKVLEHNGYIVTKAEE